MLSIMLTRTQRLYCSPGLPLSHLLSQRNLHTGAVFRIEKLFSSEEVGSFLRLTGDINPIHVETQAAIEAGAEHPILPGILCASLFPAVIAQNFPGAIYLTQTLKFRKHAQVGQKLFAEVTVRQSRGRHIAFSTHCFDSKGGLLLDGEALARLPSAHRNEGTY